MKDTVTRYHPNVSSTAPEQPAQPPTPLPCTPCVLDAKRAAALGAPILAPLAGAVMFQGMLLCDIRHTINVGAPPPSLLIAGADALPNGGLA